MAPGGLYLIKIPYRKDTHELLYFRVVGGVAESLVLKVEKVGFEKGSAAVSQSPVSLRKINLLQF